MPAPQKTQIDKSAAHPVSRQDYSTNSRRSRILFFLFALALAALIFAWSFYINKGILSVAGPVPFTVKVGSETFTCAQSPCEFKLSPRRQTVIFKKDGYYDDSQNIKINRWKTIQAEVKFIFIPVLSEKGRLVLPHKEAPLIPDFIGKKSFAGFPANAKSAQFSSDGKFAILFLGREVYMYDTVKATVYETNLSQNMAPAFTGNKIVFLDNPKDDKQELSQWLDGKIQPLIQFGRPFEKAKITGDNTGNKLLIQNETDGVFSYYLIDLVLKSRKRLEINESLTSTWAGAYIVFEKEIRGANIKTRVFAINSETLEQMELPAVNAESVIGFKKDRLLLFSDTKVEKPSAAGLSITEALEEAQRQNEMQAPSEKTLYLTEFAIKNGDDEQENAKTLLEFQLKEGEEISRLSYDTENKKVLFTVKNKTEENLFEVELEERGL